MCAKLLCICGCCAETNGVQYLRSDNEVCFILSVFLLSNDTMKCVRPPQQRSRNAAQTVPQRSKIMSALHLQNLDDARIVSID